MKNITIILIIILFCSCTEKREPVELLSKVDSLKMVAYKYTAGYILGNAINHYIKVLDTDPVDSNIRVWNSLRQVEIYESLEESPDAKYWDKMEYEIIESNGIIPEFYVYYVYGTDLMQNLGKQRFLTAFDEEGTIYFLFGFVESQYDVLLKRNIKHIETIDEANQIIDLYNQLNYILDVFEIKKFERKNDSLAMSMLNQPKIDGDTIVVERLFYADQLERYIKQTYRISKDLDFDVKMERLLSIDRD